MTAYVYYVRQGTLNIAGAHNFQAFHLAKLVIWQALYLEE